MAAQSRGELYDIGYQHYEGPREGRNRARFALWTNGVRTALGIGRGARAKILPILLFAAITVPAAVIVMIASFAEGFGASDVAGVPGHADYYDVVSILILLFSAIIAPELLCADRRSQVLQLYLVRPLSSTDYVAGRWLAFFTIVLALVYSGQMVLFAGFTLSAEEPLTYVRENWLDVPRFLAAGAVIAVFTTTIPLAVSGFTNPQGLRRGVRHRPVHHIRGGRELAHNLHRKGSGRRERGGRSRPLRDPDRQMGQVDRTGGLDRRPSAHQRHDLWRGTRLLGRGPAGERAERRHPDRVVCRADGGSGRPAAVALPKGSRMTASIVLRSVSKWYGNVVAVNDVSLEVHPGVTGLLGPNGAGKTTVLHMMAGLADASEGEVEVLGQPVRDNPDIYHVLGMMSEHEAVYPFYTGRQFVELAAELHELDDVGPAVDRAIEYVGLTDVQDRALGTYSRGMRQRMRLAASLVHGPEVLILDEPLNGTDPRQRIEFHDLMRRLASEGRTVLVSSHILEEVETVADRHLLMVSGKLAASGEFRAIREALDEQPYKVRIVCEEPRAMASALVRLESVESVSLDDDAVLVMSRNVASLQRAVPVTARELGLRLTRVEPLDESLESVFSYVVEG